MRRPLQTLMVVFALVCVSGCSFGPQLDGSNPQSLAESADAIRETLSDEERKQFDDGLALLRESVQRQGLRISQDEPVAEQQYLQRVDGLNASEVIAAGNRIRDRQREKVEAMFPHLKGAR